MIRDAFHPKPKGYPTKFKTYTRPIAAMGKRNTSVCDKNGNALYPKCVMYQYHAKAAAYKVLLTNKANKDFPRTKGNKKNWTPSVKEKNKNLRECVLIVSVAQFEK